MQRKDLRGKMYIVVLGFFFLPVRYPLLCMCMIEVTHCVRVVVCLLMRTHVFHIEFHNAGLGVQVAHVHSVHYVVVYTMSG